MDIIEKYTKEFEMDAELNQVNLKDRQYKHPTIRLKWWYRLRQHQRKMIEIKRDIEKLILVKTVKEQQMSNISGRAVSEKLKSDPDIIEMKRDLIDEEEVVDYIDGLLTILAGMGFDMKNLVELIKMEQL